MAIRSILGQTYENWELLLIDDGSGDGTLEVARAFSDRRILVFSDSMHKGLVPRLNEAVALSRGKYFARMDADDVAYPERIERQVEYLTSHPEIDLVGCGMLVFKGDGAALGWRSALETHEEICRRPWGGFPLGHPTWMGRAEWFRANPYDERAIRTEDQDLLLRTYRESRFAGLPDLLVGYREESVSLKKSFVSRLFFSRSVVRDAIKHGDRMGAARAVVQQGCKYIADTFAVCTGLNYRILRHRARPLQPVKLRRWSEVWSELQERGARQVRSQESLCHKPG